TIDQHKIKRSNLSWPISSNITRNKFTTIPVACIFDVILVYIYAEIIRMCKVFGIRARPASDVQNSVHLSQVVMKKNRRKFLLRKWRLPRPVKPWTLKQAFSQSVHNLNSCHYK